MALVHHLYSKSIAELVGQLLSLDYPGTDPMFPTQRVQLLEAVVHQIGTSSDYDTITNAGFVIADFLSRPEGVSGWKILTARLLSRDVLS